MNISYVLSFFPTFFLLVFFLLSFFLTILPILYFFLCLLSFVFSTFFFLPYLFSNFFSLPYLFSNFFSLPYIFSTFFFSYYPATIFLLYMPQSSWFYFLQRICQIFTIRAVPKEHWGINTPVNFLDPPPLSAQILLSLAQGSMLMILIWLDILFTRRFSFSLTHWKFHLFIKKFHWDFSRIIWIYSIF